MAIEKSELEVKKARLEFLLESRSKASCDTRNLTAADMKREEEIEDLEDEIKALEAQS
jgi:hypothetical protein